MDVDLKNDAKTILQVEDSKADALLIRKQLQVYVPDVNVVAVDSRPVAKVA